MAIDSRQKRFSMLYVAVPAVFVPLFEADGAVDADDRLHLLHFYSGIAADSPASSPMSAIVVGAQTFPTTAPSTGVMTSSPEVIL